MADKEHLAILKQGVEEWNRWRKKNSTVIIDLREADFRGVNLRKAFFGLGTFDQADFSKADLRGASFRGAILTETLFESANLSEADFRKSNDLKGANLKGANLKGAFLSGADLRKANFSGMDFSEADLSFANLNEAVLNGADLSTADLTGADLYNANLNKVNLSKAKLIEAFLYRANLSEANVSGANFYRAYLSGATFSRANLNESNLADVDLTIADFREADLSGANLTDAKALGTDFRSAIFTGACIQDWNINHETILSNIFSEYVYLKFDGNKNQGVERRPHARNFKPREFTKLFQIALETVDIVFSDRIDWRAFFVSFLELKSQTGSDDISIQSFENRNGAFVVRINVPLDADKAKIERFIEDKYQVILDAKDKEILLLSEGLASERQTNTDLREILKTMAEKENSKYYLDKVQIGNFIDTAQSGSRQQSINHQHNYAPEQKQMLADAAAEIQQLLKQLGQTNPNATEADQKAFLTAAIPPTKRQRFANALQGGGKELLKELMDNMYLNVAIAAIEGWQSVENTQPNKP
jgi:uncharacterized protein YjbI with pentapeptide repeats